MDRNEAGRFVTGNKAAVGRRRPHAAQVATLRATLFEAITPDRLQRVVNALIVQAEEGNVAASRLILEYCLGKPLETDILDRIEALEEVAA